MSNRTDIEDLEMTYIHACNVCDPVDFAYRQRSLLHALANYIIQRDKPKEESDDS